MVLSFRVFRPASGSVTPKHALFSPLMIGGSQRFFCSGVPFTTTGCSQNTFMLMVEAPDTDSLYNSNITDVTTQDACYRGCVASGGTIAVGRRPINPIAVLQ